MHGLIGSKTTTVDDFQAVCTIKSSRIAAPPAHSVPRPAGVSFAAVPETSCSVTLLAQTHLTSTL